MILWNFVDLNLKQLHGGGYGFSDMCETTRLYFSESNSDSSEDHYPTDQYNFREHHTGGYHVHIRLCMTDKKIPV